MANPNHKPRERSKGVFLGVEFKTNPGVICPPDQIPQEESERFARILINILKQRDSEPDGSG